MLTGMLVNRFAVLIGPINHLKHLISRERLPFSAAYVSSLALTLYFSLGVRPLAPFPLPCRPLTEFHLLFFAQAHSYVGSLIFAIIQVLALLSYIAAYFPGGTQTLRFGGAMALRGAGSLLPI